MNSTTPIICSACGSTRLYLKYEATYEYSYVIDSNAPGRCNDLELLPYMYDTREQKEAKQYIECASCRKQYPCYFGEWNTGVTAKAIQDAISSGKKETTG